MNVRAKFRCESVTEFVGQKRITLRAVSADEIEENRRYHKYTPSGEINITIDNPPAAAIFKPGESYYVDFLPIQTPSI